MGSRLGSAMLSRLGERQHELRIEIGRRPEGFIEPKHQIPVYE
jgi:hypothetical protein